MKLEQYFSKNTGIGVMATSSADGMVDTAIYSKPHVLEKDKVAFIMRDHLTHQNLQQNMHACYLFMEEGRGYSGVRLFLTKVEESEDDELIQSMTRRSLTPEEDLARGKKFLVSFKVNRILALIGAAEIPLE